MGTFDLGQEVQGLQYDFTTRSQGWDPANGPGKGLIIDPSRQKVKAFQKATTKALGLSTDASQADVEAAVKALDSDGADSMADAMFDALADLCGGAPSRSELDALSVREFNAFAGWMHAELSAANPT